MIEVERLPRPALDPASEDAAAELVARELGVPLQALAAWNIAAAMALSVAPARLLDVLVMLVRVRKLGRIGPVREAIKHWLLELMAAGMVGPAARLKRGRA